MIKVSYAQVPSPFSNPDWNVTVSVDILEDDAGEFYAKTSYPLESDLMGPFSSTVDAKEHLWMIYGRPCFPHAPDNVKDCKPQVSADPGLGATIRG